MDIKKQAVLEYLTQGFTYRQLARDSRYFSANPTCVTTIEINFMFGNIKRLYFTLKGHNNNDKQQIK
jgi:hypothetical protein